MKQKPSKLIILMLGVILLSTVLSACGPAEPTIDIDAQKTGFAQTADVQATMTAEAQPTATETPEPTATFTPTPEATQTPAVTATDSNGAATSTIGTGTDSAQWRGQTPDDNTKYAPGDLFKVTWTLENTGSTTWTTNYYIEYFSGEQMDAEKKVQLPYPVAPGTNVQVSVDFKAPATEGVKRSDWRLVNANDVSFFEFYIIIEVEKP